MKTSKSLAAISILIISILGYFVWSINKNQPKRSLKPEKGCVYMTVMGEQSSKNFGTYKTNDNISMGIRDGLEWLSEAQHPSGGYGAGSHSALHIKDPHAVKVDPATTAMVALALLRSGNTLDEGKYATNLAKAINFLMETVESAPQNAPHITNINGTQIQRKLGQNIDAVLTAQLFSKLLIRKPNGLDKKRISRCLGICISKIEQATDHEGRQKGAGWAGVLQSGLAYSALEEAKVAGAVVDEEIMERSRDYQKQNYDASSGNVKTADGAGVVLYSISNSVRASAKQARTAAEAINEAKKDGTLEDEDDVSIENLRKAGVPEGEVRGLASSYDIYQAAKEKAQEDKVIRGFGNNGGEEFLSFLQTGESLVVNGDKSWKKWYDNISGRLLKIQNKDGSWNGHHCITSPVFCTATSVLLLTVENDIDYLVKIGE